MLICAIQIILALVVLGVAVVAAYICLQGDAKMFFDMKKRTVAVKVSETDERVDFEVELDYKNVGIALQANISSNHRHTKHH